MRTAYKLFVLALVFFGFTAPAQVSGQDIRSKALQTVPGINLEDKLLFISVWKSSDYESRQNNKEFNRVANIYSVARLKNARKGVCFVTISLDDNSSAWHISVKKDSINCNYNFENTNGKFTDLIALLNNQTGSIVVDAAGAVLAKDMKKEDCFPLFHSLITR